MGTSAYNIHYFSSVHKVVHQKVHKVVVHKVVYQAFGLNISLKVSVSPSKIVKDVYNALDVAFYISRAKNNTMIVYVKLQGRADYGIHI